MVNDREERRLNLREVADRAGVAMSSVSRVLSDHPDVSPKMRERVLAVVEELGYEPNLLAQSLRRGSTLSIGFVLRDISSPLFSEIVLGAETEIRKRGYSMLLTNSEGSPSLDATHIRLFRQRRVDGIMVSLADEGFQETLDELRRVRVPVVLIDRELPAEFEASAVVCDHRGGIRAAVEHLIALGHRRIGLASGPLNLRPGRELRAGLEEACAAGGAIPMVEAGPFSGKHGKEATERLLRSAEPPTAVIAGSNQILPGVLRALRSRGLRIPHDVSLVTVDDVPLLEFLEPPVAAIAREGIKIGREAATLMLRRLEGGEPETSVVPTEFLARPSCASPRT